MQKKWTIDSRLADFDFTGVAEFLSQYSTKALNDFNSRLNVALWTGLQGKFTGNLKYAMQVVRSEACIHTSFLAQLKMTHDRARKHAREIVASDQYFGTLNSYLKTQELPDRYHNSLLLKGPPKSQNWRAPVRFIKSAIEANKIQRLPKLFFDPSRHVLVTARTLLSETWINQQDKTTIIWDPSWYFSKPLPEDITGFANESGIVAEEIASFAISEFQALGMEPNTTDKQWLVRQYTPLLSAALWHLQCLEKQSKLPNFFFAASCGLPWEQMMRISVKQRGGSVTSFEHGCGLGFHGEATAFLADLQASNYHVCFDHDAAHRVKSAFKELSIPQLSLPQLLWSDKYHLDIHQAPQPRTNKQPIALFAPQHTAGERVRNGTNPPDLAALDLNARIIGELKNLGCNVIIKPHPADAGPGKSRYERILGFKCSSNAFENEMRNVNLIVSAAPTSTTILAAINSGIPLTVVDPDCSSISTAGKEFIRAHARYLKARFSPDERFEVDWCDFRAAIQHQLSLVKEASNT